MASRLPASGRSRIAQFSSFLFGVIAVGLAVILVLMLWEQADAPVSHPLLLVSLLVTTSNALIMLVLYVFSAYLGRMYLELKGRPTYIVMEPMRGSTPEGSSP